MENFIDIYRPFVLIFGGTLLVILAVFVFSLSVFADNIRLRKVNEYLWKSVLESCKECNSAWKRVSRDKKTGRFTKL